MGRGFPASFLQEGAAMVSAVSEDFAAAGHDVRCLQADFAREALQLPADVCGVRVSNAADHRQQLALCAGWADRAVIIAPETGGVLLSLVQELAPQVQLLSPGEKMVQIATDKVLTNQWLRSCGVPVPQQQEYPSGELVRTQLRFPFVAKPRFGAGSEGVHVIYNDAQLAAIPTNEFWAFEQQITGTPVSVGVICGSESWLAMPTCTQHFGGIGFEYLGGECPVDSALHQRAAALAVSAVAALPAGCGWAGVDLVLGDDPSGRDDYLIEVNPRLTTSYVGVRDAIIENPAELMIQLSEGRTATPPVPAAHVTFQRDGQTSLQVL